MNIIPLSNKINQSIIDRITNLASYGTEDSEIINTLKESIDEINVTERWVKFVARMARREFS